MGEIKSTMDLVMERTRHMVLTDEEKKAQRRSEFLRKLRGVLQKYQDQALSMEETVDAIRGAMQGHEGDLIGPVADEIIARIDPEGDNDALLDLLLNVDPDRGRAAESLLKDHAETMARLAETRTREMRNRLKDAHAIAGAAVVPNLSADPAWRAAVEQRRASLRETLAGQR